MNRILRFIYAALIVTTAVACHTSEIDDPNNDNPDKPKITDNIQITASIKQTRVSYSVNNAGNELEQRWMVGDAIYGFYGESTGNKIVFSVESVDDETGVASLKPESGWGGFLSAFKENNKLAVGLVYTGCTTSNIPLAFQSDGTIEVDMANQGTERIPACMHADSFDTRTEDDVTYVIFEFQNDCSILEVFGITGAQDKDVWTHFNDGEATLESLQVPITYRTGEYYLDGSELKFRGINSGTNTTTVSLGGSWAVTTEGDITYDGNIKPVLMAVVPFSNSDIKVTATLADSYQLATDKFNGVSFVGGNSYYIMANPVVARTVDGVYFKTVSKAFEHASAISSEHPTDNTVTLVKDEIYGLVDHTGTNPIDEHIDIDYPVTLDLNGCILCLGNITDYWEEEHDEGKTIAESFFVADVGELTISDLAGVGTLCSDGNIASSIIKNEGTVIIEEIDGFIEQYGPGDPEDGALIIENEGSLFVEEGVISSYVGAVIDSHEGSQTVIGTESGNGPSITSKSLFDYAINIQFAQNSPQFLMQGGDVKGDYGGINLYGINVNATISGGKIHSSHNVGNALFVQNGTCNISGANTEIYNNNSTPNSNKDFHPSAVYLENATADISGGAAIDGYTENHAIFCYNSSCEISGENTEIMGSNGVVPAIYCIADTEDDEPSFIMLNGTVHSNSIAVKLGKNIKGTISNGTIESDKSSAIVFSGSSLSIGGNSSTPEISTKSTHNSLDFVKPAILVEKSGTNSTTLTIKSGKISGVGDLYQYQDTDEQGQGIVDEDGEPVLLTHADCGAIQLNGEVTAEISGGTISSTTGYAIIANENSSCTISGNTSVSCISGGAIRNYGSTTISGGTFTSNSQLWDIGPGTVENYSTITKEEQSSPGLVITGGEIVSDYIYALYNEENAMAIVKRGDLSTNGNDNAVVNYGDLIIGDPSAPSTSNDAITITSSNSLFPAIYCSAGGTFNMHYGTVKGPAGAVDLKNYTDANIYGGYFESDDGITVFVHYGSNCTIKGGTFYKKGSSQNPTIFCSSFWSNTSYDDNNEDDYTVLSIEWPESTETKDGYITNSVTNKREPLIYCAEPSYSTYYSTTPVGSYLAMDCNNYSKIFIKGGYLFSNSIHFYSESEGCANLQSGADEFGGFYANKSSLTHDAGGEGSEVDLFTTAFGGKNAYSMTPFTPDFVSGLTDETSLYYIK